MLTNDLQERLQRSLAKVSATNGPQPKRGAALFDGNDHPHSLDEFVGQKAAVARLEAAVASAKARGTRLDHVLLAGTSGAGKSALATILAAEMDVGLLELSGRITPEDAKVALRGCQDGDILFLDEVQSLVSRSKRDSDWLLSLLQGGALMTASGVEQMPAVTVVAASTDIGVLPTAVLNRFAVRPHLVDYTLEESAHMAAGFARSLGLDLDDDTLLAVARAALGNSRDMKAILISLRDSQFVGERMDLDLALEWTGLEHDGQTAQSLKFLTTLLVSLEGKGSLAAIAAIMRESGPLDDAERRLLAAGFMTIESGGRVITQAGSQRVVDHLTDQGLI